MTAPTTQGSAPGNGPGVPPSPVPRRWTRPRWFNLRVLLGVLLLVGSITLGAWWTARDRQTVDVWSAAEDLAAGSVLAAEDVVVVPVRLGPAARHYLPAEQPAPVGQVLTHPVSAGELLPARAVAAPTTGRVVVLPVKADRLPSGVRHGSTVDVYLTSGGGSDPVTTEKVLQEVTVQSVETGGGLASSAGSSGVSVTLTPEQADTLVPRLAAADVLIVLVTG